MAGNEKVIMKAKIINKEDENYNKTYHIEEIHEEFVCLWIENRKCDYGKTEIIVVAKTDKEYFELGKYLIMAYSHMIDFGGLLRHTNIAKCVNKINFPASKRMISKAISEYVWN
jgi:hypothetical protein